MKLAALSVAVVMLIGCDKASQPPQDEQLQKVLRVVQRTKPDSVLNADHGWVQVWVGQDESGRQFYAKDELFKTEADCEADGVIATVRPGAAVVYECFTVEEASVNAVAAAAEIASQLEVSVSLLDRDNCAVSDGTMTLYFRPRFLHNEPYCDGQDAIDAYLRLANETLRSNAQRIKAGEVECWFNGSDEEPTCEMKQSTPPDVHVSPHTPDTPPNPPSGTPESPPTDPRAAD